MERARGVVPRARSMHLPPYIPAMPPASVRTPLVAILASIAVACTDNRMVATADSTTADELQRRPGYVIDSIRPMAEEIRLFQDSAGAEPDSLRNGAPTREALVARFMSALAARDSSALSELHLDRAEFAYFYFPASRFAAPPYELPPSLVWRQMTAESNKGIGAALRLLGGNDIQYRGHECRQAPEPFGAGRTWGGCRVGWRVSTTGDTASAIVFGSILERGGRFKFVSYSNEL